MKRIVITPILIHIYTFITIVSMLFAPLGANDPLLDLGASSGFIGLALSGSDTVSWFIGAPLFLWCITSPIALIVFYILSYKRIYIPFAVFAAIDGDKATMHVVCSDDAVKAGAHAGKIVGEVAAVTGGKGGGKPQSATAGVGDMDLIDEALSKAVEIVSKYIK